MLALLGKRSTSMDEALRGKVVAIYCREGEGGLLRNVRLARIGDRGFLVGQFAPKETRDWSDITCWLAIDDILKILVFDTIEEARTRFAAGEEAASTPA